MTDGTGRHRGRPRIDDWYVLGSIVPHLEPERCPACGSAGGWIVLLADGGETTVQVCQGCGYEEVLA